MSEDPPLTAPPITRLYNSIGSGNGFMLNRQLECLHSENTHHHPTITLTIDSYWIPSQNMTKSKWQIWKICQKLKFWNFEKKKKNFIRDTPFEVKISKYKWIRKVLLKIQTVHRRMDRQTDGQTTLNQYIPLSTSLTRGIYWQRCQHSIFKMLNDFEIQSEKCLIYDKMVKNLPIFCLICQIFFAYIKQNWKFQGLKWVMIKQNE